MKKRVNVFFVLTALLMPISFVQADELISCTRYVSNDLTAGAPLNLDTCVPDVRLYDCIRSREKEAKIFGNNTRAFRWDIAFIRRACSKAAKVWHNPDY